MKIHSNSFIHIIVLPNGCTHVNLYSCRLIMYNIRTILVELRNGILVSLNYTTHDRYITCTTLPYVLVQNILFARQIYFETVKLFKCDWVTNIETSSQIFVFIILVGFYFVIIKVLMSSILLFLLKNMAIDFHVIITIKNRWSGPFRIIEINFSIPEFGLIKLARAIAKYVICGLAAALVY